MNGMMYLLQVNLYLLFFYLFYLALLRNETFFKLNRLYLVGSTLLAMAIPLLKAEWIKDIFVTQQIHQVTQTVSDVVIGTPMISETVYLGAYADLDQSESLNANQIFWILYGSIVLLLLLNFFRKLYLLSQTFKSPPKHQAFSFFKKVLIDEELQGKETIFNHEMVHIRQWHSLDVVFFELFAAFNWFNPISYAYKKAIRNIHEFIADDSAASTLEDRSAYALLLVSNVFNTQPQKLTNSFFNQSLIKRRIIMLHKTKSRKVAILKYGLSVPLFAMMVIFSSATIEKSETMKNITGKIEESIPSVVGAIIKEPEVAQKDFDPITETPAVKKEVSLEKKGLYVEEAENPGLSRVVNYFNKTLRYPPADQAIKLVGTTFVSLELDETGAIINPSIISAMSQASYHEVIRVIKLAKPFGEGIGGKYLLPIKFSLSVDVNATSSPRYNYQKDSIDLNKFRGYKTLDKVHVRGYLSQEAIKEFDRLERLYEHFSKLTKYPATDKQNGIAGRNLVAFELDQTGAIQNPSFITAISDASQNEIMRIIKSAEPFGEGNEGQYILPIIFMLNEAVTMKNPTKLGKFSNYRRLNSITVRGADNMKSGYPNLYLPITDAPQSFTYTTADETKDEAGKIVNYIKVSYLFNPIILVDGKEASYKITDKGFKLDNTIYPKQANIKIYTREAAVEKFNDSAKEKGLISITTGPEKEQ